MKTVLFCLTLLVSAGCVEPSPEEQTEQQSNALNYYEDEDHDLKNEVGRRLIKPIWVKILRSQLGGISYVDRPATPTEPRIISVTIDFEVRR